MFGQIPQQDSIDLVSPCNTSDGWLKKKGKILNGQRVLVKGGSGMAQQESFNEVVASLLCRKLGISYVEYSLLFEGDKPYSVCPNMTTDRQDFVSAYYIFSAYPRADGVSAYEHFLSCCEKLGVPDVTKQLQQMMILDYLICDQNRHFCNFGAIRDAVTLEWVGFAPIFDSGTSLWFDQYASKIKALADAPAKPFAATQQAQLAFARDGLQTLDLSALNGCKDEVLAIFEQAHFGEPDRANILADALAARCEFLQKKCLFQNDNSLSRCF